MNKTTFLSVASIALATTSFTQAAELSFASIGIKKDGMGGALDDAGINVTVLDLAAGLRHESYLGELSHKATRLSAGGVSETIGRTQLALGFAISEEFQTGLYFANTDLDEFVGDDVTEYGIITGFDNNKYNAKFQLGAASAFDEDLVVLGLEAGYTFNFGLNATAKFASLDGDVEVYGIDLGYDIANTGLTLEAGVTRLSAEGDSSTSTFVGVKYNFGPSNEKFAPIAAFTDILGAI
ncbi:hypothetical protein GCM10008927_03310 [Amylibacter ulvae]|uniref:Uncharacterized protein n=1 Tax=Paramylibacter ulvae TaxID=1651968 RepID=A0ABQ3CSM9_9RHOB|nr:hypothetical protein [Amylibacter ulvae]GHA42182.1 hypothetical protein GCM10008927_03310 [Amylibacter ulvae]